MCCTDYKYGDNVETEFFGNGKRKNISNTDWFLKIRQILKFLGDEGEKKEERKHVLYLIMEERLGEGVQPTTFHY